MELEPQISFRKMPHDPVIEDDIRKHIAALHRFAPRITGCRVLVEAPHRRGAHDEQYHVRIDLTVPGSEVVVNRDPAGHESWRDVHTAIRDAFLAARRQLTDHTQRQRGETKHHDRPAVGTVVRLLPEGGGFIAAANGREIYFHAHSVRQDQALAVGTAVHFREEPGEQGPQATMVVASQAGSGRGAG